MEKTKISAANMAELVSKAFLDCLFKDGEVISNYVYVEGITRRFGFHPQRLEQKREIVVDMLAELPVVFKEGYTFLHICYDKKGQLWTGSHKVCEQLVVMAMGLGLMSYCLPREYWHVFPGGLPYVIVE